MAPGRAGLDQSRGHRGPSNRVQRVYELLRDPALRLRVAKAKPDLSQTLGLALATVSSP